jgi:peptidoglycan/xylan/chitin deacetylase (PgdA/CDA1 family)
MMYPQTLPLDDHEVVLTFDDGPLPHKTNVVLDELAAECVKATFFVIGRMAKEFPDLVQRIHAEGHTIGTHTQNHLLTLRRLPIETAEKEIDDGVTSAAAAAGSRSEIAPFIRLPGLRFSEPIEEYAKSEGLMIWASDVVADDWRRISAKEVVARALARLDQRGRGILLLHDIQKRTASALPQLLAELKRRQYKIVHVIAADAEHPKTPISLGERPY